MLKEICITPQVFDNNHIDSSNWKDIKNLLETIKNSGYILGLNNNDWYKEVIQKVDKIDDHKVKEKFKSILSLLKNRGRIYGHPKSSVIPQSENDWLSIAEKLNELREFYSIIATKHYNDKTIDYEDLEDLDISEYFGFTGSRHFIKSEEQLENIFLPLLSYAKKLTIIDPYFYIHEVRYKTTLNIFAKFFKERRGLRDNGTITINCKWDDKLEYDLKKWSKIISEVSEKYGHIIIFNLWSRKENGIKMHERYLITESTGIFVGAGTDKDDYQQSEWGLKEYHQLDEIRSQYDENADVFKLEYVVTSSNIRKNVDG